MNSESSTVVIDKKRYNTSNLKMLIGLEDSVPLKDYMKKNPILKDILNIGWVLDKPSRLPETLKVIYDIRLEENIDVRLALARAQIDAALSMNENLQKYTKQKFVAETIERMIFGDLLLEGKSPKNANSTNGKEKRKGSVKKKQGTRRTAGKKKTPKRSEKVK